VDRSWWDAYWIGYGLWVLYAAWKLGRTTELWHRADDSDDDGVRWTGLFVITCILALAWPLLVASRLTGWLFRKRIEEESHDA
jgi:hypothetical protein